MNRRPALAFKAARGFSGAHKALAASAAIGRDFTVPVLRNEESVAFRGQSSVAEHDVRALTLGAVDLSKVLLVNMMREGEKSVSRGELLERLKEHEDQCLRLNAAMALAIRRTKVVPRAWRHPGFDPRHERTGRDWQTSVLFPGTVYEARRGMLLIPAILIASRKGTIVMEEDLKRADEPMGPHERFAICMIPSGVALPVEEAV